MSEAAIALRPQTRPSELAALVLDDTPARMRLRTPEDQDTDNELAVPSSASRRSVWALIDQGVVSLGNCVTNVMLARSLTVSQFGIFAILLEAMLFLNTLQAALVIYPLSVRGAMLNRDGLRRLAGACLVFTLAMVLPLGLILVVASNVVGSMYTGVLCASALVAWQCQETLRRAMMAHGGQRRALPADAISYLGQAVIVVVLAFSNTLTVNVAFAVLTFSSGAAVLVQCIQIGPKIPWRIGELRATAGDFWQLGRWVLMGNLTLIVTTLGCSWTLVYFHGTDAVGRFQALANLMKLSNPLTICMAGLIVPAAARAFRTDGLEEARRITLKYAGLTAMVLAPYFLFLVLMPTTAIHLLYGQRTEYATLGNPLRAFVLWYAALFIGQAVSCLLNAIEQSRRTFLVQSLHTAAVVVITLPLTAAYGLDGLMLGGVLANVVMVGSYLSIFRRLHECPIERHTRRITEEMRASARIAA